jgi:hypothetical protein
MRLPFAVATALVALVCSAASAHAEVGFGPPVVVYVPADSQLVDVLRTQVVLDEPYGAQDVTVAATLHAGGRRFALPEVTLHATDRPQTVRQALPPDAVAHLARLRRTTPGATGLVDYRITAVGRDGVPSTDTARSRVTFSPPVRSARPTTIPVRGVAFTGSTQAAWGTIALAQPRGWPRTSRPDTARPTFAFVAVVPGCEAWLRASAVAVAMRDPSAYLAGAGGAGDRVFAGALSMVRSSPEDAVRPSATAVSLRRIARHRYAGVRVNAFLLGGCPAAAARDPRFVRDLLAAVHRARVAVAVRPW